MATLMFMSTSTQFLSQQPCCETSKLSEMLPAQVAPPGSFSRGVTHREGHCRGGWSELGYMEGKSPSGFLLRHQRVPHPCPNTQPTPKVRRHRNFSVCLFLIENGRCWCYSPVRQMLPGRAAGERVPRAPCALCRRRLREKETARRKKWDLCAQYFPCAPHATSGIPRIPAAPPFSDLEPLQHRGSSVLSPGTSSAAAAQFH